jgi:hypothetical protein
VVASRHSTQQCYIEYLSPRLNDCPGFLHPMRINGAIYSRCSSSHNALRYGLLLCPFLLFLRWLYLPQSTNLCRYFPMLRHYSQLHREPPLLCPRRAQWDLCKGTVCCPPVGPSRLRNHLPLRFVLPTPALQGSTIRLMLTKC